METGEQLRGGLSHPAVNTRPRPAGGRKAHYSMNKSRKAAADNPAPSESHRHVLGKRARKGKLANAL